MKVIQETDTEVTLKRLLAESTSERSMRKDIDIMGRWIGCQDIEQEIIIC